MRMGAFGLQAMYTVRRTYKPNKLKEIIKLILIRSLFSMIIMASLSQSPLHFSFFNFISYIQDTFL